LATRAAELARAIYEQGRYDEASVWTGVAREAAGDDDLDAALVRQPVEAMILARNNAVAEAERLARATLALVSRTDALTRHADTLVAFAEILKLAGRGPEARARLVEALALFERKGSTVSAESVDARLASAALAT
jgi:hypothetical protein